MTCDLYDYFVNSKKYFTEKEIVCILKQVLTVVEYLHSRGISACGIEPSNIAVTHDAKVFLTNLEQKTSKIVFYMSPEVVRMQKADEKSDMWSVGVIAYILLTGQPPFDS